MKENVIPCLPFEHFSKFIYYFKLEPVIIRPSHKIPIIDTFETVESIRRKTIPQERREFSNFKHERECVIVL